jgi:uncharacterized protein YjbI with pentapeptide repeats
MADQSHLDILQQGVEAWNSWREQKPSVRTDLSGANLSEADLSGAFFSATYNAEEFRPATNLSGANLFGADLSRADLSGANLSEADLSGANLSEADLSGADLSGAYLSGANLTRSILVKANLSGADLSGALRRVERNARNAEWSNYGNDDVYIPAANLSEVDLSGAFLSATSTYNEKKDRRAADLSGANLSRASLRSADLVGVSLVRADLSRANLREADLSTANLDGANLSRARLLRADLTEAFLSRANLSKAYLHDAHLHDVHLSEADLSGANLSGAYLSEADLSGADLSGANLSGANLTRSILVKANLERATLEGCRVFGISAWSLKLEGATQHSLNVSDVEEPAVMVDNLEVAQFVYLLLNNEKIRDVIDTIGEKGVLILGRFTEERKPVLDAIRDRLRELGFVPMMFDFERATKRDFTETIKTLAGLSRFVIADITNPRSSPLELQATMPDYMIPFVPIIHEDEEPFAMFRDLQQKYGEWVLDVLEYDSAANLQERLYKAVVKPALDKSNQLIFKKAEAIHTRHINEYQ